MDNRWQKLGLDALMDPDDGSDFKLVQQTKKLSSKSKTFSYDKNGVPDLFLSDNSNVTEKQKDFYNEILFPNYDAYDNIGTLLEKGSNSSFTKKLDDEIPYFSKVLELGCGTGQMSLYLHRYGRIIHGVDISTGSLGLGEEFRKKNQIENVFFSRMNVFNLMFKKNYFDVIVSNGVLHHTKNARLAFANLCKHLKPGGLIVIGLYHKYGRLVTNFKQLIAPYIGEKIFYFDRSLRHKKNDKRKLAWEKDQFFNPHETSHTLNEIFQWLKSENIKYVNSIPFSFNPSKNLFDETDKPTPFPLWFKELSLSVNKRQIREGGFFIFVGKKLETS